MITRTASERLIYQGRPSTIRASALASPDCRRVAYVAGKGRRIAVLGGKRFVIVDGEERKHFGRIEKRSLVFSPDSRRVAYAACDSG
jgi:hypothetical protein